MQKRWCILIHSIPSRPLYLRAKVLQRLARIGAVPLKNSVYLLPWSEEALEDFQWVAQEVGGGGGQACIVTGPIVAGITPSELTARFRAERTGDYQQLGALIKEALEDLRDRSGARPPEEVLPAAIVRLSDRFKEIQAIDFFHAPIGKEVERMLQRLEKKVRSKPAGQKGPAPGALRKSSWVTRRGIKIDRMATAWLVRRFIDPQATFRFVDVENWQKREGEIGFDISGGDYTHEGDRCTFETVIGRFRVKDPALRPIAQIIHDIDLKEAKYGRADTAGIRQLVQGIVAAHARDEDRLERGFALFDDLYRSFQRKKG